MKDQHEKLKAERDDALRYKKYWTEWVSLQSGDLRKLPERAAQADIIEAERDELAAQVEKMRKDIQRHCRYINSDYEFCCGICGNKLTEEHHPDCSMSLPDISTSILNRVRAEALRKAADIFESKAIGSANMSSIRALAADMEAGRNV